MRFEDLRIKKRILFCSPGVGKLTMQLAWIKASKVVISDYLISEGQTLLKC
jgi:hypothetical protein